MGISKYNVEERKIAREIYRLKNLNHKLRRKYLDKDIKINNLIKKLNGKYGK